MRRLARGPSARQRERPYELEDLMSTDPVGSLTELELDVLWTVYEGHSLVIERPEGDEHDDRAHVIMSVAYDEADEAVAEVAEIPLDTVEKLIGLGFLAQSQDGPVLDAHDWFDEEIGLTVRAEEYLLSDLGRRVIDDTAAPGATSSDTDDDDDAGWDDDDDEFDDEDEDELDDIDDDDETIDEDEDEDED